MRTLPLGRRRLAGAILMAAVLGGAPSTVPAAAQMIPIKTVPVASGDQFLVRPGGRLGMAGISAALSDTLGDPFLNPAAGARLRTGRVLAAPTYYRVSEENGGAGTLPVSLLLSSEGPWFGGVSMAIQELREPDQNFRVLVDPLPRIPGGSDRLSERSAANSYVSGFVGRRLGGGWAIGMGLRWAGLSAVDGVEHLYPAARRIREHATAQDYRLGVVRDAPDESLLEAVLVHRRWSATHDVTTVELIPHDGLCVGPPCGEWRVHEETNLDRTNTTGLHLGWARPLEAPGWRLGGFLTVNRKDHPKIPNYELMNIPRDPGTTWASNLGLGTSRTVGATTVGVDAVFEPIWSETWAVAEEPVIAAGGQTILPGDRTVDNDFFFRNFTLRLGGAHRIGSGRVELGLAVRSISYELEQIDHVDGIRRRQRESWMEWTPSWGGSVGFDAVTLRYQGRLTTGTGRPGVDTAFRDGRLAAEPGPDVMLAPAGPLTLRDVRVWTHRLTLEIPIG